MVFNNTFIIVLPYTYCPHSTDIPNFIFFNLFDFSEYDGNSWNEVKLDFNSTSSKLVIRLVTTGYTSEGNGLAAIDDVEVLH